MEPLIFVLAGVAAALVALIALGRPRLTLGDRRLDRGSGRTGPRVPLTADPDEPAVPTSSTATGETASPTAPRPRSPGVAESVVDLEAPGELNIWQFKLPGGPTADQSSEYPVCFAVDGASAERVVELIHSEFDQRGFAVRTESPDQLIAHRGAAVFQITVRGMHSQISNDDDGYHGDAEPSVVVELQPVTGP